MIGLTTVVLCWMRDCTSDAVGFAPRYPGTVQKSSKYAGSYLIMLFPSIDHTPV